MLGRIIKLEAAVAQLRREVKKRNTEIEQFYIDFIRDAVEGTVEEAMKRAFQQPIELTHEEIEKAFGHRVKIVASKAGDK